MDVMSNEIIVLDSSTTMIRRFLVSQSGISDEELDILKQKIVHLRGVVEDLAQNHFNSFCTHIISKDFPVTEKILGALASGKWLLSPRYIYDCYKAKKWLEEKDYELPNYNFAAKYHRMGRVNRSGAGIYKNMRVYIKLEQKSYARAFRRVMAAGEADILLKENIHRADLVITDMQHYEIIAQQLPASNIVGIDFIKDTLVHQIPLVPLDRFFLKRAAKSQGTPRKLEAGSSTQGILAQKGSNTGYTPSKLLHIKKEPDDGTKAVASPSHIMRKSIKKIPFTPKNYRSINTYFKTENKERIVKIEPTDKTESSPNKSANGDLQIIEDHHGHRRQTAFGAMPSSSKHYQSADATEFMMETPNKKRKDSACEIVDITTPMSRKSKGKTCEIVDITTPMSRKSNGKNCEIIDVTTPLPIKSKRTIIKTDIDLTGDLSPRQSTFAKQNSSKHSPIPMIIDRLTREPGITAFSSGSAMCLEKDPGSPVITRKTIARTSRISTGLYSRRQESISRASSSMRPVPVSPGGRTMHNPSPGGSSSGMSLGSTPSPPTGSLSTMELCGTSSDDLGSSKRLLADEHIKNSETTSTSYFPGLTSPEKLQCFTDNNKQRDLTEEGEMELSYSSTSLDVDHPSIGNNMDVDDVTSLAPCDVSLKRPSPHKANRKPLTPIDMANCVDPVLPPCEDRSAPVVIRKKQMNSLVLTFMQKENHVSRTVFSDTMDLCTHHDVEVNINKSAPPREMSVKETALYESSMDDTLKVHRRTIKEQEIILQGIEYLYVALTPEAFPPPKILGHLLRRLVWQENRFPIIHSRALTLVNRVLDFHPPSCTDTRTLYLSTLRYAGSTEEQDVPNSWTFIKEIISSALDMDDDQTDDSASESSGGDEMIYKSMNSVRLLEFIQTLLQEDLRHWDNSAESMKHLMCIRMFWGEQDRSISDTSELLKVSPQISRLLRLWVKSSQAPPHIRELIARLVGVVIHLMWRCSGTPLLPVSPLPEPLLPLAREILIRCRDVSGGPSVSRGFELLQLIQDLPDHWQRTVVLTIIFKSVTASSNIKFALADLLDYGKLVGQEQEAEQKMPDIPNSSLQQISKSKKCSRSSARGNDIFSPHKVNKTNNKGETSLMRACISNKVGEMCKLLDIPGIDVNKTDHNGWSALHEAAMRGHNTCVKLLLDFKPKHTDKFHDKEGHCDIMKRGTENGMTALHDAVSSNMVETVKLLLEYGGDGLLKVKTKENETAYDLAVTEDMRQVLHSYERKKGKIDLINETREKIKGNGGLQLSQLSHSSLLSSKEECQAFILLLLNSYLNTTGFRFLFFEINKGFRRSTSMEHKQRQAQLRKNKPFNSTSHELLCGKNEDVNTDERDDCFRSHESSSVQESPYFTGDKMREIIDFNCENKKDEKFTNEAAFTVFRRKKAEEIPTRTNSSQHLNNYDNFLVPSDKEQSRNMNEIFNFYLKDVDTFKRRKEEFCKEANDADYFNSLIFILQ